MKFALVVKRGLEHDNILRLKQRLLSEGWAEDEAEPEIVIVVGGDGTMLYAVQKYLQNLAKTVFIGVHAGTLGFFMDYRLSEVDEFLRDLLEKEGEIEMHRLLVAEALGEKLYAVNEIKIENPRRTQDMEVYLDGKKFEELRSTGICVATQLGSTAYNRSLGGAVVAQGLDVLQLTEIAGIHHDEYRSLGGPLIVPAGTTVELRSKDFEGAYLGADAEGRTLSGDGVVRIYQSEKTLRLLRLRQVPYEMRLRRLF